jgi:hypothetical protein
MIKLFRKEDSAQANAIEAEFQDLLLAYDRVVIDEKEAKRMFGTEISLPMITNNEKVASGEEIPAYLKELRTLMNDWQAFQGDSCYVNDKGESC